MIGSGRWLPRRVARRIGNSSNAVPTEVFERLNFRESEAGDDVEN